MAITIIPSDVTINGNLIVLGATGITGTVERGNLFLEAETDHPIELTRFRIWDAQTTNLTTAGSDDLGLTTGVFGTAFPYITSGDLNASGALTRRARLQYPIPENYQSGTDAIFTVEAGMLNAVASVSATVDFEVYKYNGATLTSGVDLCTTAAQSINSTSMALYHFAIAGAANGMEIGDILDIRMTLATNSASAVSHFAIVPFFNIEYAVRG